MQSWALLMFPALFLLLLLGYPVAFTLGAVALLFGWLFLGLDFFGLLPLRIWGVMTNFTLLAVPLFVFMGMVLERSGLAADLLETAGRLCGRRRGGLAFASVLIGGLLAATTGVVGATVVTMGVIALPAMLKHGYSPSLASGTVAAAGTLGQIVPPSIVLILLGDVMGVPVGRLFVGAVLPGMLLICLYLLYILLVAWRRPQAAPAVAPTAAEELDGGLALRAVRGLLPPLLLVAAVLGSIFLGIASPTESAALGALGAVLLAVVRGRLTLAGLRQAMLQTLRLTSMVFLILIGATAFGLVFRGIGGDAAIFGFMTSHFSSAAEFLLASMVLIFLLGLFLDFLEICFIVVPVLAPIGVYFGLDPLWLGLLIAVNLQTAFLTPPVGFSLFYLKGAAPNLPLRALYRGVVPFVCIQVAVIVLLASCPRCALWLPDLADRLQGL